MKNVAHTFPRRYVARAVLAACAFAAALALAPVPAIAAEDFANKPIRIIVAVPPGGLTDVTARRLAQIASNDLGQSVVVENRPGANGLIGTAVGLRAPADGYTVLR